MDYSSSYFGKKLSELTINDVIIFFEEERAETDQIEFKSINPVGNFDEKLIAIKRSISGFLNSSGGLIVWGAPKGEKPRDRNEKIFKGALTYFDKVIEKDFLISKVSDGIVPLPNGIRAAILELGGKSIVVFEIESSEYSPHQTQNTYYMRIDGQTRPAPHHYIEALFKKVKYPNIDLKFRVSSIKKYPVQIIIKIEFIISNLSPFQNEENLSFIAFTEKHGFFEQFRDPKFEHFYRWNGRQYFRDAVRPILSYGEAILEGETIVYERGMLSESNQQSLLAIHFGGRYSPRKMSKYTFDFSKMDENAPNSIIVSSIENRLIKDVNDELGIDDWQGFESFRRD